MNVILRYWNYLATWREHRNTIKVLNGLTSRELNDIGLNRGDIDRLIWLDTDRDNSGGT